jgi:hypothetical protein
LRSRDAELAAVGEQLAAARAGRSTVSIIEAPAGLGKSRMLEEAATMASRAGVRVGIGRAHEGDRLVPMSTLLGVLFSDGGLLPAADVPDLPSGPEERYWLVQELETRLERAALEQPLLIALDDLQWADRGSAVALRALPPRLAGLPIAWLLALRPGDADADMEAALTALATADARRMRLGPLARGAVAELAAEVLGGRPDARLLELTARAHGSPFLLMELLQGLREEDAVECAGGAARLVSDRLPARVSQTVHGRLAR